MKRATFKALIVLIIAVMTIFTIAGCQKSQEPAKEEKGKDIFPVTVTDVYDSKITIEKEPQRIVALAPSIVEVLYKLGLGDKIVGVTDYCDYPAKAKSLPRVGNFNGVSMEKIIEAKPDIVFAGTGMDKGVYQKLTDLKIKVIVAEARDLSQIPDTFMMAGRATGTEDKAKALADEVNSKINNIKDKVKGSNKVKCYYVISYGKEGNWTGGKGTFISDLISIAGGENIADDVDSWKEYSTEKLVEKNPDLILLSSMIANGSKDILDNEKAYKETNAVKNDRVIIIDDNLTQRPGPRIVEGLELIAKAIHPEIFSK